MLSIEMVDPASNQIISDNVMLSIEMVDPASNQIISDGSKLIAGDRVLIGIKSESEHYDSNDYKIMIENCSISDVSNHSSQRVDLIRKGCPPRNNVSSSSLLSFRSITNSTLESNLFEIFKMPRSSASMLNCWLQLCTVKSKCIPRICPDLTGSTIAKHDEPESVFSQVSSSEESSDGSDDFLDYINVEMRFSVEDKKVVEPKVNSHQKQQVHAPDVVPYYTSKIDEKPKIQCSN
jgi:hypothetical protein